MKYLYTVILADSEFTQRRRARTRGTSERFTNSDALRHVNKQRSAVSQEDASSCCRVELETMVNAELRGARPPKLQLLRAAAGVGAPNAMC
jgi:hypothetical protein